MKSCKMVFMVMSLVIAMCASAFAADIYVRDVTVSFIDADGATTVRSTVKVAGAGNVTGIRVDGTLCVSTDDCSPFTSYTDKKGLAVLDRHYGYILPYGTPAQFMVDALSRAGDTYNPAKNVENGASANKF